MKIMSGHPNSIPDDLWVLIRQQTALFKALSTEHRLAIVWLLTQQEMRVGDIAEVLETSIPNVSQHLRVMRESGIVKTRREGQTVLCSLTHPKIFEGCCLLREAISDHRQSEHSAMEAAEEHFTRGRDTQGGETS